MATLDVLDRLIALLEADEVATSNTSMRLPTALRDAAALAVAELGVAASTTSLTTRALRAALETALMQAVLDEHYRQHPGARPSLADVALATAEQLGSPLAERPELLRAAADQLSHRHPDADAHDVLLWAEAQLVATE
ncbi:MAG: hypothetical protein KY451_08285 [Actinobacteria bacterium]|nr:hypothetical protein [Actinomycetota bacterium]MBW3648741.1 hypothetical protein [Actinomycetota bacterium]